MDKARMIANAIIIAAIGYLAYLIQYAVSKHASFYYFLPPIILILVLGIALRFPYRYRIRLLLLLASVGLPIILTEIVLEIRETTGRSSYARLETGILPEQDLRTVGEVVRDMRASGEDVYGITVVSQRDRPFEAAGGDLLPFAGISQTATVMCNEGTGVRVYESDEHGFQNPKGLWALEGMSIVALGDSMTQGHCVEPERNAIALIRNVYQDTLNLGFAGTGPLSQFAILKEYAGRFKPKVVLWFYFEGNDLDELPGYGRKRYPIYGKYLEDPNFSQNLIDRQPEIDFHLKAYVDQAVKDPEKRRIQNIEEVSGASSVKRSMNSIAKVRNLRHRVNNSIDRLRGNEFDASTGDYADFPLALEAGREFVDSWRGQLYFVYLPTWERYRYPNKTGSIRLVKYRGDILSLAESLGIPVIDVSEAFADHPDPLSLWPFRRFGHYNEDGYKVAAEAVIQAIPVGLLESQ